MSDLDPDIVRYLSCLKKIKGFCETHEDELRELLLEIQALDIPVKNTELEMANSTIIIRMINKVMPMAVTEMWFEYDDINEISEWASDSIQVISNLGIMKGVGNNRFAPQDTYTTEQAIVTLVRVYEKAEAAGIIGVDNDAIIGGADGPTDIVVVETVKIKDISTGEEKNLSADDSKAILDILAESNDWTEGTADCLNDCEIKIGDRTIMYHSGCGTFNDNKNMKSISLDEKVKPYINSILEKYIQLGNDETKE